MLSFIKKRFQHLKQNRSKLFYGGAHDSYGPQKLSITDSLQALEPRIMFDAAGVETGAEVAVENVAEQQAEQALLPENLHAQAVNQEDEQSEDLITALNDLTLSTDRNEIIFVDKSVEDYTKLISSISSSAELVFINSNTDGLEQVADILEGRTDIDAIHIVSHGDSGKLILGNATLTQESMQSKHADGLQSISFSLNENADILIYGCNFAEGELGKVATKAFADATGADVAASDDLTGHESLGGDWDLELKQGEIETAVAFDEATQAAWEYVLVDTDGDGVVDGADLDDDNDGILDVDEPISPSITSWTAAGGSNVTSSGDTLTYAYTGTNGWSSGSVHSDNISSLGYTDKYEVSFTVNTTSSKAFMVGLNEAGTNSTASYNDIDHAIYINGNTIRVYENGANKGYFGTFAANDTFSIEVDGTSLRYQHNGTTFRTVAITAGKDYYIDNAFNGHPSYATYEVGDFAINPLSGANDADSDGVENRIDLDSDNDGISDLVESGASSTVTGYDTNNDGTISLAEAEAVLGVGNADVDGDGLLDIFDADTGDTSAAASKGTTVIDTDSDGVKDFLDLDSDGDTIADTVEARATVGYVTNDGDVRDNDADGDGVIDLFDSNDGTTQDFGGTFTAPVNTDGDGLADYRDTDSDGDTALDSAEAGAITTGPSYVDPDGSISNPSTDLLNEFGDTSEVAYRESVNAPVNTVPGTQNVDEDTVLLFTGVNQISVTDPNGNIASAKLTVLNGVLNVTLSGTAFISSGTNGSASLTISGNETDINATLSSLSYQGNTNYNGTDQLTVFSMDATATPLVDIDTVTIVVNPVDDTLDLDGTDGVLNIDFYKDDVDVSIQGVTNNISESLGVNGAVLDAVAETSNGELDTSNRVNDLLSDELDPFDNESVEAFTIKFRLAELNVEDQNPVSSLFPLRVGDSDSEIKDQLIIKSLLRDSTIFLKVDSVLNSDLDLSVIDIKVNLLNGDLLPDWLNVNDEGKLISGVLPVGLEKIELKIEVKFSNNVVVVRNVHVNAFTGELAANQQGSGKITGSN
ncbi:MAG: DUF4347 domain-containing protein [Proteobacteria bacterium]|nr:DUF4347 domain-containing protein [Pseudomonadota bacterium]NOG60632.1 DUF4347 domain-containing protein [Pseudomonadota bacterium]